MSHTGKRKCGGQFCVKHDMFPLDISLMLIKGAFYGIILGSKIKTESNFIFNFVYGKSCLKIFAKSI